MSKFSFVQHEYVFTKIGGDEKHTVSANSCDEAWEELYDDKGDDWHSWALLGRKDRVETVNITEPLEVSVSYAKRNGKSPK